MSLKPVSGRIESQELNDNFSYLESEKIGINDEVEMEQLSQEVKEAMTGGSVPVVGKKSVGSINIKNKAVTPKNTTFAKNRNLFDGDYVKGEGLSGPNDGIIYSTSYDKVISAVMKVEPNKKYTAYKSNDTDRFGIALFNKKPKHGDVPSNVINFLLRTENNPNTFITGSKDEYVVITVSSQEQSTYPNHLQLNLGDYVEDTTKVEINLLDKSIKKRHIDFDSKKINPQDTNFVEYKNLFDGNFIKGITLSGAFPDLKFSESYENSISVVMKLESDETYTISKSNDTDRFGVAVFGKKPKHLDSPTRALNSPTDVLSEFTFTLQDNENYVVISVSSNEQSKQPAWLQVERGDKATEYSKTEIIIPNLYSKESPSKIEAEDFIFPDPGGFYKNNLSYIDVASMTESIETVYASFDDLVSRFPNYISRVKLGEELTGLPIYLYKFRAMRPQNHGTDYKKPRILYVNVHNFEKKNMVEGFRFFKDVAENWRDNEVTGFLRWNVDFDVIPLLNPYSLKHGTRNNVNNVDLNRNFETGWELVDKNDSQYGGPKPLSEIESQIFDQYLKDNKDKITFAIDSHKYNSFDEETTVTWMGISKENIRRVLNNVAKYANLMVQRDYNYIGGNNENFTSVSSVMRRGVLREQFIVNGIPGTILETVTDLGANDTNNDYQDFCVNLTGNLILIAIRNYKYLQF